MYPISFKLLKLLPQQRGGWVSYLVSLHAVLLGTARHGGGDPVPALGRGDGEGLQGLLQELLLLSGPGHRVSRPWAHRSVELDTQGSLNEVWTREMKAETSMRGEDFMQPDLVIQTCLYPITVRGHLALGGLQVGVRGHLALGGL